MSKLKDLINKLCPNGVEFLKLNTFAKIYDGTHSTPKYTKSGVKFVSVENIKNLYGTQKYISQDDFEKYKIKPQVNDVFMTRIGSIGVCEVIEKNEPLAYYVSLALIRPDNEIINSKFLKYAIESLHGQKELRKQTLVHAVPIKINKNAIGEILIPVPPLSVQEEIVKILDKFTEYNACLARELELRKKQYAHYSRTLIDSINNYDSKIVSEICNIVKGKTPIQKARPGKYPLVVTTTVRKSSDEYQFDTEAVCIPLVSSRGHGIASLNHVYYQSGKFALGNILCALIPKDKELINAKFLYHFFEEMKDILVVPLMRGGANVALHMDDIAKIKIPLPPLEVQEKTVKILDKFESLCNDLVHGLPAEIEARRKQYEFYRDKLLTFEKY